MRRLRARLVSHCALAAVLCLVLASSSCGFNGGDAGGQAPPAPSAARVATSSPAGGLHSWSAPVVSGGPSDYVATLHSAGGQAGTASNDALKVRLGGIGYPGTGKGGGTTFVGPGVALPWTAIAHGQYTVTVADQGQWVGLRIWSRGGQWRTKVDGRYVDTSPRPVGSDYALHTIGLDLSRDDATRTHVVQFELSGGAWLAGVLAGANDRLALPPKPKGPSWYWLGDSYFAGGGSKEPGFTDLVHRASARLRAEDVTVDALGGTGYVRDNTSAKFDDFLTRARKNLGKGRAQPDRIVIGGSINDIGQSTTKVQAAARRLYAYIAKAAPRAKVYVVVFTPRYPVPSNFAALNRAVLSAAHASRNVAGTLDLPSRMARSAAGLQGSNSHPTQAGHDAYGRVIASFLRSH